MQKDNGSVKYITSSTYNYYNVKHNMDSCFIEFKERNTSTCICNQQIHVWTCCVKGKLIIDVKFDCNLCRCSSF